ncbi:MAG: hypothetical protein JRI85_07780 [Deltaproteobacteria bacterium]|nr:hypothetical protein [Deltaproteobacteria bacterium]
MVDGNDVPKVMMAEKFMIVDESGNKRAILGILQGEPGVVLYGHDGKERLTLRLNSEGDPSLKLNDREGRVRAVLELAADGSPSLKKKDV